MMDLNEEGNQLARKLIDSFRSFIGETCRTERSRDREESVLEPANNAQVDVNFLKVMRELFVVNSAYRLGSSSLGVCEDDAKPRLKHINLNSDYNSKKWTEEALVKATVGICNSETEIGRGKLRRIAKDIFEDETGKDQIKLDNDVFEEEASLILNLPNVKQNVVIMKHASDCNDQSTMAAEGRFKVSESSPEFINDFGNALMESADSGVFVNMGASLYETHEVKCNTNNDKMMLTSHDYLCKQGSNKGLYDRPKSCNLPLTDAPNQKAPRPHNRSKIPVLSKNKQNITKNFNEKEKSWMKSLRESILKFKDYDFGTYKNSRRANQKAYDRSISVEQCNSFGAADETAPRRRIKSARSMMSLNHYSPRFDESASFWKQRTSLEKNYSKYVEDGKQVLKDVKCDIDYAEANDFAKRRLIEGKRRKSRSSYDISVIGETDHVDYIQQDIASGDLFEKRRRCSSLRKLGHVTIPSKAVNSWNDRSKKRLKEGQFALRKSKIPVFIGNV